MQTRPLEGSAGMRRLCGWFGSALLAAGLIAPALLQAPASHASGGGSNGEIIVSLPSAMYLPPEASHLLLLPHLEVEGTIAELNGLIQGFEGPGYWRIESIPGSTVALGQRNRVSFYGRARLFLDRERVRLDRNPVRVGVPPGAFLGGIGLWFHAGLLEGRVLLTSAGLNLPYAKLLSAGMLDGISNKLVMHTPKKGESGVQVIEAKATEGQLIIEMRD